MYSFYGLHNMQWKILKNIKSHKSYNVKDIKQKWLHRVAVLQIAW